MNKFNWVRWCTAITVVTCTLILSTASNTRRAEADDPIKIGFSMALTGALAGAGKAALLSMQIWAEDINSTGGLLGRQVELIYYDDQTNPSLVPGIYTKLINIDRVDLLVSGYGTATIVPAMPIIMNYNRLFLTLFALAGNEEFQYDRYFQIMPAGPNPRVAWSKGFFEIAMLQNPAPKTIALVGADAEFPRNAMIGARHNAQQFGLEIVYDRNYPPNTVDFTPVMRAIQATEPDLVYVASYPPDSVGIVRSINEIGFTAKQFGGGMVGLQYATFLEKLGEQLEGIVNYDFWVPEPTLQFPGIQEFLSKYQEYAVDAGVDPLGYYLPPYAYAYLQILGQAITQTESIDEEILAEHIRSNEFSTVVGNVAFGPDGEWKKSRILMVQFQNIVGRNLQQFTEPGTRVVLYPPEWASGQPQYPFTGGNN